MRKLLTANIARLKRNKLFYAGLIFMFLFGTFQLLSSYNSSIKYQFTLYLDEFLWGYVFTCGILTAIFVSFFLGTEYSDGTIRNKLIVGCSRYKLYFANFIVNITAVLLMCISYVTAVLCVGLPLLGGLQTGSREMLIYSTGSILLIVAFCSVYTMLAMCCSSKSTSAALSITGAFLFFLGEAYIGSMLSFDGYWTGAKRAFFRFIFDFLPSGQAYQFSDLPFSNPYRKMVYALLVTIIATLAGQIIFSRKNIK